MARPDFRCAVVGPIGGYVFARRKRWYSLVVVAKALGPFVLVALAAAYGSVRWSDVAKPVAPVLWFLVEFNLRARPQRIEVDREHVTFVYRGLIPLSWRTRYRRAEWAARIDWKRDTVWLVVSDDRRRGRYWMAYTGDPFTSLYAFAHPDGTPRVFDELRMGEFVEELGEAVSALRSEVE